MNLFRNILSLNCHYYEIPFYLFIFFQESSNTVKTVLDLLETVLPSVMENYQGSFPMGSVANAQKALSDLHTLPKAIETTDQLMVKSYIN